MAALYRPNSILAGVADGASRIASLARLLRQNGELSQEAVELFSIMLRAEADALNGAARDLDRRSLRRAQRCARATAGGLGGVGTLAGVQPSRRHFSRRHGRSAA